MSGAPFDRTSLKRTLLISDWTLHAFVGAYPEERAKKQRVRLQIEVDVNAAREHQDSLEEVVCYQGLIGLVKQVFAQGHIQLLESVTEQIAAAILASSKTVLRASVTAEKLDAVKDARVGVRSELQR
jgi:dihydroneopterin aldolase